MRITAGRHKGRKLLSPEGQAVRPTSDKVRQAVFNMLQSREAITGAQVLDIFCGTGALGIEALSRGAAGCAFIDNHPASLSLCNENIALVGEQGNARTLRLDATRPGSRPAGVPAATLAFFDPPYRQDKSLPALEAFAAGGWLSPDSFCIIETAKDEQVAMPASFAFELEREHGSTKIMIWRYRPA